MSLLEVLSSELISALILCNSGLSMIFKETNGSLEAINGLPFNELKDTINEHL